MTSPPVRHIVCAVRGGPESRETVKHAIALSLETGARLTFFHSMDADFLGYATLSSRRVVYRELREMGKFVMLILCDRARARGVADVDYLLREGDLRTHLRNVAAETQAGVLVMGRPAARSTKNQWKSAEMDAFVAELESQGQLRVIAVQPAAVEAKDMHRGLVF